LARCGPAKPRLNTRTSSTGNTIRQRGTTHRREAARQGHGAGRQRRLAATQHGGHGARDSALLGERASEAADSRQQTDGHGRGERASEPASAGRHGDDLSCDDAHASSPCAPSAIQRAARRAAPEAAAPARLSGAVPASGGARDAANARRAPASTGSAISGCPPAPAVRKPPARPLRKNSQKPQRRALAAPHPERQDKPAYAFSCRQSTARATAPARERKLFHLPVRSPPCAVLGPFV